ncbi:hypothetical protein F2Q70_00033718 [Brassica cretica]|uniref:Uncharacterized protein n=1 Tax=Brassica cretica TaxID=69181 RepID=A0A8S9JUL6_BRACR|nr:hypothetical protein F2Q70_00033718 [Brassica cretica]
MTKKAIRDIEIEQSLTAQRLLCSYFTEEQLETPVLDFFKENLPDDESDKEIRREEKKHDEEAERRIAAIKAIRDIEIEQSLTAQRLLCSYFTEEQLETPVLDFFKENLPDVSIEVEDNGEI